MRRLALVAASILLVALRPVPPLEGRVTDLTGTLTASEQAELETRLAAFEKKKGAQIAVLIVPTTEPEAIEQYSIRVTDAWKLGREQADDGALLLVAKDDRQLRIEVGRGLEGALTDLVSKRIVSDTIAPLFRQGDFAGGISAGLDRMMQVIEGEPLPPPEPEWSGAPERLAGMLPVLLGMVLIGSAFLRALLGRGFGSFATGAAAGGFTWWITKLIGLGIGVGVFALLFSLMLGIGGGGRWASRPHRGGWLPGGWSGGSIGRGSFGGGGFSGGGGSFGGGGASGRW